MAKMIGGPFTAVAVELPPNAPTDCKPGTTGILEIWESQRRTPGKRGVVFNYPLNERDETSRYLHTTYSYDLTLADGIACLEKEGKRYRFRIESSAEAR